MGDGRVCLYGDGNDLEARGELDEAGKTADAGIGGYLQERCPKERMGSQK